MLELVIAAVLSAAIAVICGLAIAAFPSADPAGSASRKLSSEVSEHGTLRRFMRARLDPETVAGLSLTLALAGVVIVFVVFGVAIAMIRTSSGIVSVDVTITNWAAANETSASRAVMSWISLAGNTAVVIAVALVIAAYALRRWRRWSVALFFFVVLAGQLALSNAIKVAVERVRPDAPPFQVLAGPSFPSGHATAAAAAWAAVALVLTRGSSPRARAVLGAAAAGIAVAVACSRVFLGAHWTSDVIGGLLLGWTWFALCAVAFGGRVLRLGAPVQEAAALPATTPADASSGPPADDRPPPQRQSASRRCSIT